MSEPLILVTPVILMLIFILDVVRAVACCCPLSIKTKVLSLGISDLLIGGGGILVLIALNIVGFTNPNLDLNIWSRGWRGFDDNMFVLGLLCLAGILIVVAVVLENECCLNIVVFLRCMWTLFWIGLSLFIIFMILIYDMHYKRPYETVGFVLLLSANMLIQLHFILILLKFCSKKLIAAAGECDGERASFELSPLSLETHV